MINVPPITMAICIARSSKPGWREVAAAAAATRAVLGDTIRRGAADRVFSVDPADDGDIAAASVAAWALAHGLTMLHIDGLVAAETTLRLDELVTAVSARFRKGISGTL